MQSNANCSEDVSILYVFSFSISTSACIFIEPSKKSLGQPTRAERAHLSATESFGARIGVVVRMYPLHTWVESFQRCLEVRGRGKETRAVPSKSTRCDQKNIPRRWTQDPESRHIQNGMAG